MAEEMDKLAEEMDKLADDLGIEKEEKPEPKPEPKPEDPVKEEESLLKKVGKTITAPARWCWRKVKDNPAAAAVGAAGGAVLTLGTRKLITWAMNRNEGGEIETDFTDEDPAVDLEDDCDSDNIVPFDKEDAV